MKCLDEIQVSPNDRAAVVEAAEIIRRLLPVEEIVLFGSKARGDDDEESDIDLLVLTVRKVTRQERRAVIEALLDIELQREVVLSTIIVPAAEWTDGLVSVLPIRAEVEEQGALA